MNVGSSGSDSQDFELNIASLIDCFTVLITFMLASASFISIGLLDAGVAAAGATAADPNQKPPAINVTIELGKDQALTIKLAGKETRSVPIGALKTGTETQWNYEELTRNLASVKQKYPDVNAVTLSAGNEIEYKDVVKAMEVARKTLPVVLLGGF